MMAEKIVPMAGKAEIEGKAERIGFSQPREKKA